MKKDEFSRLIDSEASVIDTSQHLSLVSRLRQNMIDCLINGLETTVQNEQKKKTFSKFSASDNLFKETNVNLFFIYFFIFSLNFF